MTAGIATPASGAPPAPPPVEAFAHPPMGSRLTLSPDGRHVAFLIPINGGMHMVLRPLLAADGAKPRIFAADKWTVNWLRWANDRTVIMELIGNDRVWVSGPNRRIPVRFSRLVAVDVDGDEPRVLYEPKFSPGYYKTTSGQILQFIDEEHVLLNVPHEDGQLVGRLNIYTGRFERQDRDRRGELNYLPDPTGQLRIASSFSDDDQTITYWYRASLGEEFKVIKTVPAIGAESFGILGFGEDDKLYVTSNHASDTTAVYLFNLETGEMGEQVLADPDFDIGSPVQRGGKVVAIDWNRDMPARHWLDEPTRLWQERLDKAIPDSTEIFLDQTRDGRFTLVASYAPNLPVIYRLFDRETRQFMPFADTYPNIQEQAIGERRTVRYTAADGMEIPAYLTLPPGREPRSLPFVVMPHGGPISRDTLDFDRLAAFLASRGYAVLQPNFRGSSGYGGKFLGAGLRQWGKAMQTDVIDGVAWAVEQGIADPARMCIVGWSYGGYSALMGAVQNSDLFKCAVATAPVTDLNRLWKELRWSTRATEFNRSIFFGGTREGLDEISPVEQVARIDIPVLLIHGDMDAQAFIEHSEDMARALRRADKPHEFIEIEGMDHSPHTTEQMVTILSAWERFLKQHIGN